MKRLLVLAFALLAGPAFGQSHPVFFQRASDIARATAMKSNYDANPSAPTQLNGQIYKYVKGIADSGTRYQDFGQFAGYMYSWTCAAGACDNVYPALAMIQLNRALVGGVCPHAGGCFLTLPTTCNNNGISGNYSREFGGQLWLLYDQIYPGLSGADRTTFLNQLNAMASCVTATSGPGTGTASGATTNSAGYSTGVTTITLASAGTGSILVGDSFTFAGDAQLYVVTSGDASVANGGSVSFTPTLQVAISAAPKAITLKPGWIFRPLDTDQTSGDYFMMAMAEVSTGSYNTTLHGYWTDSTRKIGGYTATAADGATYRNAVKTFVTDFAAGGEWVESSVYNLNTVKIPTIYAEAMRSAQAPTDNYPEITTWQQDAAEQMPHVVSPGISTSAKPYQWGDTQNLDFRNLQPQYRFELCLGLAGLTVGTTIGPKINDWCLDWLESAGGGSAGLTAIDPYPRGFLVYDATATRGDHTTIDKTRYASGEGLYSGRTGWTASDTAVWFHMPHYHSYDEAHGADPIDHFVPVWGEFVMFKGGQYAMAHPLTYGGPSLDPRGTSGLTLGGVPTITGTYGPRLRSVQAHENDDTNGFMYITGTQGGPIVRGSPPFFNMPTNFAMEHTRSLVWLKAFDLVIVHDRANAKAPATTGYNGALKAWMDTRPRKELYVHSPVSPTQGSGYLDWIYQGSNHTRVNLLLPPSPGILVENEATVWNGAYYGIGTTDATEKKFHTIITPSDQSTQFHTFLNVWDAYATGTPATVTLVQDATNKVDCALVTKGADNRLACFNAVQGQDLPERTLIAGSGTYTAGMQAILDSVRKRTTSFTVTFTVPGGSSTTQALLFDLDTSKTWTYTVNGSGGTLTPDSQGVGVVNVSGTGSKTLVVTTTGIADLVITTTSPLTNGTQNVAYSTCLVATGGLQPFTWSKTGSLPAGLSLGSSTGCITGTPSGTGASSFSVTVTDSQGVPDTATLNPTSLTIDAAATPTVINTTSIANPTVNVVYSATITVTGGTGVYTCTKSAGQTPTGLTVNSNCTVTGTATVADESASFTVQACDNAGSPSCDTQVYSQQVQFTNNVPVSLQIVGISNDGVIGYYGAPGLASGTSCTVALTGQSPQTTTTGASQRTFVFGGLSQSSSYDMTASCVGYAFPVNVTITTLGIPTQQTNRLYAHKPTAALVAQGVTRIAYYVAQTSGGVQTLLGIGIPNETKTCTTGCNLTGILFPGLYYRCWEWQTTGGVVIARSPILPFIQ